MKIADPGTLAIALFAVSGSFVLLGLFLLLYRRAARARTERLNEKLRRLTLITASASRNFNVEEMLTEALQHVVESLGATHALVRLLDGQGDAAALVRRAAVGFEPNHAEGRARIPVAEPWARRVLEHDSPFLVYENAADPEIRKLMKAEKLSALVLVRPPGQATPLGLLGIGWETLRVLHDDEGAFLVNVASLLGLTVQNLWLFEQVARAQRQWMNTFDSIADPILVHDEEALLLRTNRVVAHRLGTEPALLVGRPIAQVLQRKEGDPQWRRCPYCEGVAGKGDTLDPAFGCYLLASNSDFHDSEGKRRGTVHVLKDITDRRRAEEQLRQSEKMAAMGQLISGVAHELNNPLTAILGYGQLLADSGGVTERGADYVDKIQRQALRTHRIVQNLLSFARQRKPERLPVRLNEIVQDTLMLREYDLKLNNIRVHRDFDAKLPLTSGDAHQLQQAFLNILNNAVDAVVGQSGPGEIWVRTLARESRLMAEFVDNGPGVRDPLRVFDPFYTTKPVGKGTGLGLSICYGIVKEHNGEITVENSAETGKGAIFRVALPILPVSSHPEPALESDEGGPLCSSILLVDGEEALLELEREVLQRRCASIFTAKSGREALRVLEREKIDVVVADLKMPGEISGRDLYCWARRHRPQLVSRVVFTISDARADEVRSLLRESGCPFVQKPFQVEDLLGVIRKAVGQMRPEPVRR